jgi:hypothetical protein
VNLQAAPTQVVAASVSQADYRIAVSSSVNEACRALVDDAFTEDEEAWRKENKCTGPFALVQLGPTAEHTCESGRIKTDDDGSISTFDCFPAVRRELGQLEARALPAILSALTCVFNEEGKYVALRKIARARVGRTTAGLVLHDVCIEVRGAGYVSYNLPPESLAERLAQATQLATILNAKASRFFALGLGEDDELKRFLYFFLALEIEIHAVFGRIDHEASLQKLLGTTTRPSLATVQLLQAQAGGLTNLVDRFVWCAACVWTGVQDADIDQFKKLKRARDDIAHGSKSEPPIGYAGLAELLAHKILRANRAAPNPSVDSGRSG